MHCWKAFTQLCGAVLLLFNDCIGILFQTELLYLLFCFGDAITSQSVCPQVWETLWIVILGNKYRGLHCQQTSYSPSFCQIMCQSYFKYAFVPVSNFFSPVHVKVLLKVCVSFYPQKETNCLLFSPGNCWSQIVLNYEHGEGTERCLHNFSVNVLNEMLYTNIPHSYGSCF